MAGAPRTLEPLPHSDLAVLEAWAAAEGWNPGRSDLSVAFGLDPAAFVGIRRDGDVAASISAFRHSDTFGFLGLFFVEEHRRGHGLGAEVFLAALARLDDRLAPGAVIGMDGVVAMAPWYAEQGFALSHQDLRFEGTLLGARSPRVVPLDGGLLEVALRFDADRAEWDRRRFLTAWLAAPGVVSGAVVDGGDVVAFGALRPCRQGYKAGPLVAVGPTAAGELLDDLIARAGGGFVQIDVPEPNEAGCALLRDRGLTSPFACARMYRGGVPTLALDQVFGVTSFEFG